MRGDAANDLISFVADPNVSIQESKALTGNIERDAQKQSGGVAQQAGRSLAKAIPKRKKRDLAASRASKPRKHGTDSRQRKRKKGTSDCGRRKRLLHRYDALHRLQGMRGGVQAVEPVARRRLHFHRHVLRQHRARWAPRRGGTWRLSNGRWRCATQDAGDFSWLCSSDVCKHCERAGCLESCPTGAIIRTEFDTVYVQPDICNGCGYCVVNCPFGVIDRREDDGRAWKCTLCYDRLKET